ncbi:MAG: hypothetical protein ACREJC_02260 [Tepidisphaeraceae bacterium]
MLSDEKLLRAVFSCYGSDDLLRLSVALDENRVIRGAYVKSDSVGCILYHLGHVRSRLDLEAGLGRAEIKAHNSVIRMWDIGLLTATRLRAVLDAEIAMRREINDAEARQIRRVRRTLAELVSFRRQQAPQAESD